jgi:hypothetical protein
MQGKIEGNKFSLLQLGISRSVRVLVTEFVSEQVSHFQMAYGKLTRRTTTTNFSKTRNRFSFKHFFSNIFGTGKRAIQMKEQVIRKWSSRMRHRHKC